MPQGNSLCSYLKQEKMSFSFFYKIREQEGGTDPAGGFGTNRKVEELGKECKRVKMVQILCAHVYKWKNETC
jgi:hypothetical protein